MKMITDKITYFLRCDASDCNNYYDGNDGQAEKAVIADAITDGWMVDGHQCYCPDHRPDVSREEVD